MVATLKPSNQDRVLWSPHKSRQHSLANAWKCLSPSSPRIEWSNAIQFDGHFPRSSFISWFCVHNTLATKDRLLKWGIQLEAAECELCSMQWETRDHLFFDCPVTKTHHHLRPDEIRLDLALSFDLPYPTKAALVPDKDFSCPDLLTTSCVELRNLLSGSKNSEICGPLTSFNWNEPFSSTHQDLQHRHHLHRLLPYLLAADSAFEGPCPFQEMKPLLFSLRRWRSSSIRPPWPGSLFGRLHFSFDNDLGLC
ncbi:hypothetical protein CRG98_023472 [Punica granatum]|uniref:Reverse transcriptase zinc-binding domain-containing protein n=1 Tax=Punica granatum TaxID=22663 RepID=A0A2I0JIM5_PUNGR|nr:hypothetical protein CRG98_023472 [Punica granatum]